MVRATAHEIEYHYFEQFRRDYELPAVVVEYADAPDVRLKGDKYIGVEMARLYVKDGTDPSSEQVQTSRRDQVLSLAREIRSQEGGRSIELFVDFDPAKPITDVPASARRLALLAKEIEGDPITLVGDLSGNAEGLRFVYHSGVEHPAMRWRSLQVFNVPNLDPSRITAMVAEKTKKASKYAPCDEYWLLLVIDFFDPAQDQEIVLPQSFRLDPNPFQRVLLYKPQFGQVMEIPQ